MPSFFVEFNSEFIQIKNLAEILKHVLSHPIFLRVNAIPQEFGITGHTQHPAEAAAGP